MGPLPDAGGLLIQSALPAPGDLALFSFRAPAGASLVIHVNPSPGADPSFQPFFTVYSPSFDSGATGVAPEPGVSIAHKLSLFGDQETEALLGVSDFSGAGGAGFLFDLSLGLVK